MVYFLQFPLMSNCSYPTIHYTIMFILHSSNPALTEIKAANSRITAENAPRTAVFVGATSGIGKATLTRVVAQKIPIKIYVIGRNATKQRVFLDELPKSNKKADIVFMEAEVSLMAETKRVCNEIKATETSLDAVFLSTGYIPWGGSEGHISIHKNSTSC